MSQSPALHVSSICQFSGPPGIPPTADLTSVICNGFRLRLFSSFSVRRLPSFLFPLSSSSLVVRYLSPICPLPHLPIPRPPHLPETRPRNPLRSAVGEHAESSRAGVSGTRKIPGEPSLGLKNRGRKGPCHSVSAPKYQKGRNVIAFEDLSTSGPRFPGLGGKKGSVAANRNLARTPDPRVSQAPDLHVSSICQIPGSPGIPPPAALTFVICNGFRLRLFSSCALRHLSSFLLFMRSSSLVARNQSPLCPLLDLSSSQPPHIPETGAAEPAVYGGRGSRRKFPGGSLRNKEDRGGTFAEP